ncbi:MAG: hypothetical protein IJ002_00505 [Clostridia bacterium]|nr:hypothetical protein [Clostridia bacterium]
MKRIIIALTAFAMLMTLSVGATNIRGDVDQSGICDIKDVIITIRSVLKKETVTGSDFNRDGKTSLTDVLGVLQKVITPTNEEGIDGMTLLEFLSDKHSPKAAADAVMAENMIKISTDAMKGTHDAQYVFVDNKAYVVYEANDVKAGDLGTDPAEYCTLVIVDLETFEVESVEKFAYSQQVYANETLPVGSCFVPRVIHKDEETLRMFFASQYTDRQAITYYVDYDIASGSFDKNVYRLNLKTADGTVEFTPEAYIELFRAEGRECKDATRGAYLFDIFDIGDTKYIALNLFNGGLNSLAKFNDTYDCIEIIGNIGSMTDSVLTTENGIMQLKDGTWMAILRNERGDYNYLFSYSKDGTNWTTPAAEDFVKHGTNSKPILAKFGDYYIMGYNEYTRGLFHIAYSFDAKNWKTIYSFYAPTTFQYPEFDLCNGQMYFSVTMGNKEEIWYGKLPICEKDGNFYIEETADAAEEMFADLTDFTSVCDVQTSSSTTWQTYVKRDTNGVYFYAETNGEFVEDKLFFLLDTQGTATSLGSDVSPDHLMFRICGNAVQVQSVYAEGTRGYKPLALYGDVKFFKRTDSSGTTKVGIYLPYTAITDIAPYATFANTADDLYIAVYGAHGSREYVPTICEQTIVWKNPSTYVIFTSDGTLKAR